MPILRRELNFGFVQSVRALDLLDPVPFRPLLRFYELYRFHTYYKSGGLL
jgi:hypothetical protein